MFRIYDGRKEFFQWDLDRKLIVDDDNIKEVHFCNRTTDCALPVATYKEGELTVVNVPNLILQESFRINVYAYDGEYTKHAARFEVVPRSKPDTYVYTETEIKTWDELYELVKQIEENGVSDEKIAESVQKYLEENDINVDLTGYATEEWVNQQIQNIDIPEVDLSEYAKKSEIPSTEGLATEEYVDDAIDRIQFPDSGEEVHVGAEAPTDDRVKIWVDTDAESPVATKEYVAQKIAEAQMAGADVDLSAYYTKEEVDNTFVPAEEFQGALEALGTELNETYYTKEQVDELIADIPTSGGSDVDLTDYYNKTEADDKFMSKEEHDEILTQLGTDLAETFYSKEEIDNAGYQTAEEVQSAISTALSAIGIAEEVSF